MPNLNKVLGEEIRRLARKEIRSATGDLQKSLRDARGQIVTLRKRLQQQERQLKQLSRKAGNPGPAAAQEADDAEALPRFSPDWVKKHREKLGLSAADYGLLVGVSGLTIYNWEKGSSTPRRDPLRRWGAVRQLGKREAIKQLETLSE